MTIPGVGGASAGPIAYTVNNREYIAMPFGSNPPDAQPGDVVIAFTLPR